MTKLRCVLCSSSAFSLPIVSTGFIVVAGYVVITSSIIVSVAAAVVPASVRVLLKFRILIGLFSNMRKSLTGQSILQMIGVIMLSGNIV